MDSIEKHREYIQKMKERLTETIVQNNLYQWLTSKRHTNITPNLSWYLGETDLFSVDKDGFTYDFEIKLSANDFQNDFLKVQKHDLLQRLYYGEELSIGQRCPNYFYFVFPPRTVFPDDVPVYCGYIVFKDFKTFKIITPAPRLHERTADKELINQIQYKFYERYWKLRNKS